MKKLFISTFLALALLTMTAGTTFAQEITPITGDVQSITFDETTGETIVVVTLLDKVTGETQIVNISLETAETLGLVVTDPVTGESKEAEGAIGKTVEIDPETVIPQETPEEEAQHPVGSALADFFSETLGVDYEMVMSYHKEGVGFGVIAQALWLSNSLGGDSSTFEALIKAKQSGDYSAITLADGSVPNNWGDVVKSLKKGENLGKVMSGSTKSEDTSGVSDKPNAKVKMQENQNGKNDNDKGNNNEKNNKDHKKDGNNGKGNGKNK